MHGTFRCAYMAGFSVAARLASSGDVSNRGQEESETVGEQQRNPHAYFARGVDPGERPVASILDRDDLAHRNLSQR